MHAAFTHVQLGLSPQPPSDPERDIAVMNNLKKEMFHCCAGKEPWREQKDRKKGKEERFFFHFIIH